jgi:fatty-acid peroxygenase
MHILPPEWGFAGSALLLREWYPFLHRRLELAGSDVLERRVLGVPVICLRGPDGARLFHDAECFAGHSAEAGRKQVSLPGAAFTRLLTKARMEVLMSTLWAEWESALERWRDQRRIVLFSELQEILCRAACVWAGVSLEHVPLARKRTERWIGEAIQRIRARKLAVHGADVELVDVIGRIVAMANYIAFIALALREHLSAGARLESGDPDAAERFVREVRRYYPFEPFELARVRSTFIWRGHRFLEGRLALLDVYATRHDPRLWDDGQHFNPERFRNYCPDGERNPREWIEIEAMKLSLRFLIGQMQYAMPAQDLRVDLSRTPVLPKSRVVLSYVRRAPQPVERPPVRRQDLHPSL